MGSKSNDRQAPTPGGTAARNRQQADPAALHQRRDDAHDGPEAQAIGPDGAGAAPEDEDLVIYLPPIPDWMRKAPKPKQPSLFD